MAAAGDALGPRHLGADRRPRRRLCAKGDLKFGCTARAARRLVLVRMKPREEDRGKNWLLIKKRDDVCRATASEPTLTDDSAASKSGRTMDEIERGERASGARTRRKKKVRRARQRRRSRAAPAKPTAKPRALEPGFVEPSSRRSTRGAAAATMAARDQVRRLPHHRAVRPARGRRCSRRSGLDWTERFGGHRQALADAAGRQRAARRRGRLRAAATAAPTSSRCRSIRQRRTTRSRLFRLRSLCLDGKRPARSRRWSSARSGSQSLLAERRAAAMRSSSHFDGRRRRHSSRRPASCGLEGIVSKRADRALPLGPRHGLAEGQVPAAAGVRHRRL